MRKRIIILISVTLGTLLLSFSIVFLRHKLEEAHSSSVEFIFSKEDYVFSIIESTFLVIIPAFILGFISWLIFKRKQSDKAFHFIVFNLIGLILLISVNGNELYKIWYYNKYQANIDYNESLTRHGGFPDTCMILVQSDIKGQGVLPNDFRILSYSYDPALSITPRDTSTKYYSFEVLYSKENNNSKTFRAASYLINFNHEIKRIYDVDTKDERANKQIESLKQDIRDFKKIMKDNSDSSGKSQKLSY